MKQVPTTICEYSGNVKASDNRIDFILLTVLLLLQTLRSEQKICLGVIVKSLTSFTRKMCCGHTLNAGLLLPNLYLFFVYSFKDCTVCFCVCVDFFFSYVQVIRLHHRIFDGEVRPRRPEQVRYTLLRLKSKRLPGGLWAPCIQSRLRANSSLLRCGRMKLSKYGYPVQSKQKLVFAIKIIN